MVDADSPQAPDEAPRRPATAKDGASDTLRVAVLSVAIAVLLVGGGFAAMKILDAVRAAPTRAARPPIRTTVRVEPATRSTHVETLIGYGRARPLRAAAVPAEIAATITWVSPRLEAGARVAAGEELVRLDTRDAEATLAASKARRAQAHARLGRAVSDAASLDVQIATAAREVVVAERELARLQASRSVSASDSEVDAQSLAVAVRQQAEQALRGRRTAADADHAAATAEIAAADADLVRASNDVARATVRAPYAGTIRARTAQPGERVTPGSPLFTVVDLTHVEVPISLPGSRLGEVALGAPVELRLRESGDVVWRGAVSRLSPAVDPERRTFDAYVDVVAPDGDVAGAVPPGAFVVAHVEGRSDADVIVVPREAFVGDVLYVAEIDTNAPPPESGTAHVREAHARERRPTIRRRLADVILVETGLAPGDSVIVTGVDQIADGSRVLVLHVDSAAAPQPGAGQSDGAER